MTSPGTPAQRGFTLIELMIALVVAAVLCAVAVPAYSGHVQRARVAPALAALATLQLQMEVRYQSERTYGSQKCLAPVPTAEHFVVSCTPNPGGAGYVASASGIGAMANYEYQIDERGNHLTVRHPNGVPNGPCWSLRGQTCES